MVLVSEIKEIDNIMQDKRCASCDGRLARIHYDLILKSSVRRTRANISFLICGYCKSKYEMIMNFEDE